MLNIRPEGVAVGALSSPVALQLNFFLERAVFPMSLVQACSHDVKDIQHAVGEVKQELVS